MQSPVSFQPGQPGLFHVILIGDQLGANGASETITSNPLAYRSATLRPEVEKSLPCVIVGAKRELGCPVLTEGVY